MNDYVTLLLGLACAGIGGELFVRGAVGLAHWLRISPGIIGATIAAFATSSPELSVSISSAMSGVPQIALGDALGSNVVNVALILAVALTISGILCPRDSIRRDFPMALLIPVITGVLILDGTLGRLDGVIFMGMFLAWLVAAIIESRKQRSATESVLGEFRVGMILLSCLSGLTLLLAAGYLIVVGARGIAMSHGMDEFIIGATVVAVGTSVPELATAVIAKLRGHDEVGLGTLLGSNVFNGAFIISVAAVIHPITVDWQEVVIALVFGFVALILAYPTGKGFIERKRGFFLLALYAVYLTAILQQ
ncbi:MAG: sodium:calcium antiporter [Gammaproteobacteria bacterium RIFCSPLOWO2_02_FULL_61_13]|nr:MAG: sodium:calcium antiporter [Gammaproteobacteria bacterium RIFCSPLOWO2_02_FULL_61_13]